MYRTPTVGVSCWLGKGDLMTGHRSIYRWAIVKSRLSKDLG